MDVTQINQFVNQFHFLYPEWLIGIVPMVLMMWWLHRRGESSPAYDQIVDPALVPFVLTAAQPSSTQRRWLWGVGVALLLAVIALAGPSWQKVKQSSFQNQQAAVIVMDLSASMYAEDVKPDRLSRARFELIDLLKRREDGQTGLIVYAGAAFVVTPLTDDIETIIAQAKYINPEDMPVQGSLLAPAIDKAIDLLKQAGMRHGQIIVMTDGVDDVMSSADSIRNARSKGYSTSILSIGTKDGAPVPLNDGGFLKDQSGNIVVPKVNEADMQRLVSQYGDGVWVSARFDDEDLQKVLHQFKRSTSNDDLKQDQDKQLEVWRNEGIWLVLLLIPVALLMFRRGLLSVTLLILFLPQPDIAYAGWWDDLWSTPDQQAKVALDNGQAKVASETFEDPDWKAASAYKAGEFKQAAELYSQNKDAQSLYNLGNALAKSHDYANAIKAYESVLDQQADHEDAKYNLDLLKKRQAQQQSSDQSQEQQQNGQQGQQGQQEQPSNSQSSDQAENQQTQEQSAETSEQEASQAPDGSQDQLSDAEKQAQENEAKEQEALEQFMQEQTNQNKQDESEHEEDQSGKQTEPLDDQQREQNQATEQWLRRIPDDPSGLWRRKFNYQYRREQTPSNTAETTNPW